MTEGIIWEVTSANANGPVYQRRLEQGWEPFCVIRQRWQEGGGTIMWLRRQTAISKATSP